MRIINRDGMHAEISRGTPVSILHLDKGDELNIEVQSGRAIVILLPDEPIKES